MEILKSGAGRRYGDTYTASESIAGPDGPPLRRGVRCFSTTKAPAILRRALRSIAAAAQAAVSSDAPGDRAVTSSPPAASSRANSPDVDQAAPNGPAPDTATR